VAVLAEQLVVDVHELALADRGARLPAADVMRALLEVQLVNAHGDRAGGDEHDLAAGVFEVGEHARQVAHAAQVELAGVVRERRGADLEYDALRVLKVIHAFLRAQSVRSASSKPACTMFSGSCENIELMDS